MECSDTVLLKFLEQETGYFVSRSETPVGIRFPLEPGFSMGGLGAKEDKLEEKPI